MTVAPGGAEAQQRREHLASLPLKEVVSARGVSFMDQMRRVFQYRELLDLLVRRELKVRYKDSSLGFLWTLIRPLAMLAVYWVAVGKFLGAGAVIPMFPIYLFTGLTLWQLVAEVISSCTGSILANQGLVKKVDLPLEVFPLAAVGASLFNFVIQTGVLLAATALAGVFPLGGRWLYAPLSVAVVLSWAIGLGFILAAINVYLRDVQYLVEITLMIWFWACPVVYAWSHVQGAVHPILQNLYLLNPMALGVLGFEHTFWVAGDGTAVGAPPEHLATRLLIMLVIGVALCFIGQRVFQRLSGDFAQEL